VAGLNVQPIYFQASLSQLFPLAFHMTIQHNNTDA